MTVALDIGASGFRSLRINNSRLTARTCDAVYSVVEDTSARRQMLDQLGMEYAVCEGNLAIPGDAARDLAQLFQVPLLPLLPGGRLPEGDPPARQLLATLLETVLPVPMVPDELCGLTLPGESAAAAPADQMTRAFLVRLVQLRGYTPKIVHPGMAIGLAELVSDSFSGIGISFGASACHACLSHRGMMIATCVIPRGGNWIDEQVAISSGQFQFDAEGVRYLDVDSIARWKKMCDTSILDGDGSPRMETMSRAYTQLVDDVVSTMGREMRASLLIPEAWPPMTVVACGGPTHIPGFADLLDQTIRRREWPVPIRRVRIASDTDFTIPRGALILVEVDQPDAMEAVMAA